MLALHVSVPIACFRKGMAREYLETEQLPPPATCYGMLLSLVGETDRRKHVGARVTAALLGETEVSVVLRTKWRIKNLGSKEHPVSQGQNPFSSYPKNIKLKGGNVTPDYQQLLTGATSGRPFIDVAMYLESDGERPRHTNDGHVTLEQKVAKALDKTRRHEICRFGGLSLGESTHLVDSVSLLDPPLIATRSFSWQLIFVENEDGMMSLPVWVDHVGSVRTRHVVGDLVRQDFVRPPAAEKIPMISPD